MNDSQLHTHLTKLLPKEQVFTDELYRLTKGTDAGLYRLVPKAVVKVNTEDEVIRLLQFCSKENVPVTFKAAGTSLSGQTVSDSILMEIGQENGHFRRGSYRNGSQPYVAALPAKIRPQTGIHQLGENWRHYCQQRQRFELRHPLQQLPYREIDADNLCRRDAVGHVR